MVIKAMQCRFLILVMIQSEVYRCTSFSSRSCQESDQLRRRRGEMNGFLSYFCFVDFTCQKRSSTTIWVIGNHHPPVCFLDLGFCQCRFSARRKKEALLKENGEVNQLLNLTLGLVFVPPPSYPSLIEILP